MKQSDINEKLLQDLQNQDAATRKTAIMKLGELKANEAHIITALNIIAGSDENIIVRRAAESVLRDLGIELHTSNHEAAPKNETAPQLTQHDLLEKLVKGQEEQNSRLAEIQKHTGCLYAYLVRSIVIGVIALLISLFFR